jgi:hypothetical protein
MKCIDFEKIWNIILIVIVLFLVTLFGVAVTADHQVRFYYLSSGSDNNFVIRGDANWDEDFKVPLDRSVTIDQAIILVNEMNESLHQLK